MNAFPIASQPYAAPGNLGVSRRVILIHAGVALSGGLALVAAPHASAQEATPAGSTMDLPPLLQQLIDAANARDGAALAALYAEDGSHEDVPSNVVAHGRDEIAAYVSGVFVQYPDLRLEPVSGHMAGDLAVLEYTLSATDPESGQPIVYRGVLIFEIDENLIRRSADYYDVAAILGQLGLLPDLESAATPAT